MVIRKQFFHQGLNIWSKEDLLLLEKRFREHLNKLDVHNSMGFDRIAPMSVQGAG